jgi:thermitase
MEDLFYYSEGKKIPLIPSLNRRAVKTAPHTSLGAVERVNSIMAMGPASSAGAMDLVNGIILFLTPAVSKASAFLQPILPSSVKEITVFEASDGSLKIVTEDFIVQFRPEISPQQIADFNQAFGVIIKREMPNLFNTYILNAANKTEEEVIRLANLYKESGLANYSHPDFIRTFKQFSPPNVHIFDEQWALENTGQNGGIAGQDININEAWSLTQGSPNIIIAILDTGIDYFHPDLNTNINGIKKLVTGYDALNNTTDQQPGITNTHGTACAGIAAAGAHNGQGIAGVAPFCRLMGVRISKSNEFGILSAKDSQIADGITRAVANGADILSCSWGGGDDCDAITNAIKDAKSLGRKGKGCVIVFAAGNDNKKVNYPASLNMVLAITACNQWGERKSYNSKDQEDWWAGNYGPEVDVCAPGVNIWTTTNVGQGELPYRNYDRNFGGTSAATPMVAGIAALILSINPNLTANEVERMIKSSATNLETLGYDVYTGFGRVNAGAAVQLAVATL